MTFFEPGTIVDLAERETLVLSDIAGATLRVNRGTLWVTQEHDTRDVVLNAGDVWQVDRDGDTIIEAQTATTLSASGVRVARALRRWQPKDRQAHPLLARLREGLAGWWSLAPQRHIPHV